MQHNFRPEVLKTCLDTLAEFPYLTATPEKVQLLESIIDTLGGYPKPREKGDHAEPPTGTLAAYLFVSNARNAVKLGCIGSYSYADAARIAANNLESAFSLIVEA